MDKWSARQVEELFRQVSGSRVRRPGWSLARIVSYAIASCVHVLCPALLAVGVWLLVTIPNLVTVILAISAFLPGIELRPRLGNWRKQKNVKYRKDAPELFVLLDQIAAGVGGQARSRGNSGREVECLIQSGRLASAPCSNLGLPLWDALSADQRIAVLGHESRAAGCS